MAQVDEDSEENSALRGKARKQEVELNEIQFKLRDQETLVSKLGTDKSNLEAELK